MFAIEMTGIHKRFGECHILRGMSLQAPPGAVVCLHGPSGCGKTTVLRMAAGLDVPDAGEIRIAGNIATRDETVILPANARGVGMVFQDFVLWPHMRVEKHLEFVLAAARVPRAQRRSRIDELCALCQLHAHRNAYPAELSGGQQQRLAIMRALAPAPPLLLLDEPFSNLDTELRNRIGREIANHARQGAAVIIAAHSPADAAPTGCTAFIDMAATNPPTGRR